jgi:predicted GIY-YIG superfamily endonuclease
MTAYKQATKNSNWNVYIIYSNKYEAYYAGISQNVDKRLKSHNRGGTISTKFANDWVIHYSKFIGSYQACVMIESILHKMSHEELSLITDTTLPQPKIHTGYFETYAQRKKRKELDKIQARAMTPATIGTIG